MVVFGGGVFRRWLGAFNVPCALIRPRRGPLPFSATWGHPKDPVYEPGTRPSPDTESAGTLIMDSQLQNCKKGNVFCLSHPACGILVFSSWNRRVQCVMTPSGVMYLLWKMIERNQASFHWEKPMWNVAPGCGVWARQLTFWNSSFLICEMEIFYYFVHKDQFKKD